MNELEPPCRRDCDARRAGCHAESCPYGWAEYERAKLAELTRRQQTLVRHDAARPVTAARQAAVHSSCMREKRRRQTK